LARLPSDVDLGGTPSGNSGRPIASYDATGYARGAAALAGGVSDLGKGGQAAARDIAAVVNQQQTDMDSLDEAKANSNYLIRTKQLRDEISTATDPSGLEEKYKPQFQQAYEESAGMISNPRRRELWGLKTAPDLTGQALAVGDKVFDLQKTQSIADANQKLDDIRQAALRTSDPAERGKFISTGQQLLTGLKDAGYIDAVTEQKYRKKWTEDYAASAIQMMPPEERVKTLSTVVQGRDQVLDRIGQVENATGNPAARASTSSAMGNFQFTHGTWLETVRAHRPDLLQGRSEQQVLDLRADPKVSREMAGYLLDDNSAVLRNQGITPTPTNLYLAHFLGASDAAKVIKAAPGTPISDIVSPASIAANKSVLEGKTTDTVIDWSGRKMGGSANQPLQFDNYSLPGKEAALIEYHRDNLRNGTYLDKDGDISTVYITGIDGPGGKTYNVPGYWDGKLHTDPKEIGDHAESIGWDKWPAYATPKLADAAAKRDHEIIDADTTKFRQQKQSKNGGLADFIPEDKRYDMLHTARQEVEGGAIDQQRQIKLQAEQVKAISDSAENEVLKDLHSDRPKMTVQSIALDDRLTNSAKERMIAAAGRVLGADQKADKTYGSAFMNIYQRIHLPDGSPEKITDPSSLYALVGQKDGLTIQGVDKLVGEINARKTPEGVAESEMKKQFLKNAKTQISAADDGLHIPDPKGELLYLKWLAEALPTYEAGKKAGKTPAQLLNPDSPDYVGKSIGTFIRPRDQWYNDVVSDQPASAAAASETPPIKTLSDLVAAYHAGRVSKAQADQMAVEKGWFKPKAAVSAVVPVSQ
jgi:hypothetical protein